MHTTDTAGGKHGNTRSRSDDSGGTHRGGSVVATRDVHGQISGTGLAKTGAIAREVFEGDVVDTNVHNASYNCDGCRDRTVVPDFLLKLARQFKVGGIPEPMSDDG